MESILAFVIIIFIILLIDKKIDRKSENKKLDSNPPAEINSIDYSLLYEKKMYLMTPQELKFYKLLKNITNKNNLNLFSQVSLYEIVRNKNIKDFNKIKSKTIDFVITDVNCKIKVCIELDDITHIKESRQERDKFIDKLFKDLDIKFIRIPVQSYYNMQDIENAIKKFDI